MHRSRGRVEEGIVILWMFYLGCSNELQTKILNDKDDRRTSNGGSDMAIDILDSESDKSLSVARLGRLGELES